LIYKYKKSISISLQLKYQANLLLKVNQQYRFLQNQERSDILLEIIGLILVIWAVVYYLNNMTP